MKRTKTVETKQLNCNIPVKTMQEFDETWKRVGKYHNRTHAVLTAMQFFIEENKEATK